MLEVGKVRSDAYLAFDLLWHSPELPIPELPIAGQPADGAERAVIQIEASPPSEWPQLPAGPHDTTFLQMGRGDLRLTVEGIGQFRIHDGMRIDWHRQGEEVSDQDLRTFLLGSAVGALLIQRGMLVLHGNALEKDGKAIVCLGHSGAGKSTLAYSLMQQGWRLLADDLVAVNGEGMVLPGIPRIKLWHDAAKAFGLDPATLPPIREGMNKYLLMGEALQRAPQAAALQAVYLIHQQRLGEQEEKGATIRRIQRQQAATLRLRNQAFRPRFVRGLGQEGANFMALARLQQRVPLAALPLPAGIGAMQRWLADQDLLSAAAQAETGEEEPALEPAAP